MKYPENWIEISQTLAIISLSPSEKEKDIIVQVSRQEKKKGVYIIDQLKGKRGAKVQVVKLEDKIYFYIKENVAGISFYDYYLGNNKMIYLISLILINEFSEKENEFNYLAEDELKGDLNTLRKIITTLKFIE